jgi:hypothetical protein
MSLRIAALKSLGAAYGVQQDIARAEQNYHAIERQVRGGNRRALSSLWTALRNEDGSFLDFGNSSG